MSEKKSNERRKDEKETLNLTALSVVCGRTDHWSVLSRSIYNLISLAINRFLVEAFYVSFLCYFLTCSCVVPLLSTLSILSLSLPLSFSFIVRQFCLDQGNPIIIVIGYFVTFTSFSTSFCSIGLPEMGERQKIQNVPHKRERERERGRERMCSAIQ